MKYANSLLRYLQVYYKFNCISMLREPVMLIFGFFILFVSGIIYMHSDMSISKSSASYLAKLQWDEVRKMVFSMVFFQVFRCFRQGYSRRCLAFLSLDSHCLVAFGHLISGANCDSTSSEYYQQMLNHTR